MLYAKNDYVIVNFQIKQHSIRSYDSCAGQYCLQAIYSLFPCESSYESVLMVQWYSQCTSVLEGMSSIPAPIMVDFALAKNHNQNVSQLFVTVNRPNSLIRCGFVITKCLRVDSLKRLAGYPQYAILLKHDNQK